MSRCIIPTQLGNHHSPYKTKCRDKYGKKSPSKEWTYPASKTKSVIEEGSMESRHLMDISGGENLSSKAAKDSNRSGHWDSVNMEDRQYRSTC